MTPITMLSVFPIESLSERPTMYNSWNLTCHQATPRPSTGSIWPRRSRRLGLRALLSNSLQFAFLPEVRNDLEGYIYVCYSEQQGNATRFEHGVTCPHNSLAMHSTQ